MPPRKRRRLETGAVEEPLPAWAVQGAGREEVDEAESRVPAWAMQGAGEGSVVPGSGHSTGEGGDARRATGSQSDEGQRPWASQDAGRVYAGTMVWKLVFMLYAVCKISAKDVCILMYWIAKAGATGDFERYGVPDGEPTGHYQRHLDGLLPQYRQRGRLYKLLCPVTDKHGRRVGITKHVRPPFQVLNDELKRRPPTSETIANIVAESAEWGSYYTSHPTVIARREHEAPVIPCALYVDGIRYSRQIGSGRAQSLVAFTLYNLLTMKRHLLAVFHKSQMCKCGCRSGMCTLYPFYCS